MINAAADSWTSIHAPIDLPPFPALESLRIYSYDAELTLCLMSVLSSITSAPVLAKIAKESKVERGPLVTPTEWLFRESLWEELLQRFREAGGRIKPCSMMQVHRYR